jgi:hypothetical protein
MNQFYMFIYNFLVSLKASYASRESIMVVFCEILKERYADNNQQAMQYARLQWHAVKTRNADVLQ